MIITVTGGRRICNGGVSCAWTRENDKKKKKKNNAKTDGRKSLSFPGEIGTARSTKHARPHTELGEETGAHCSTRSAEQLTLTSVADYFRYVLPTPIGWRFVRRPMTRDHHQSTRLSRQQLVLDRRVQQVFRFSRGGTPGAICRRRAADTADVECRRFFEEGLRFGRITGVEVVVVGRSVC